MLEILPNNPEKEAKEGNTPGMDKTLKLLHVHACGQVHCYKGQVCPCPYEGLSVADHNKKANKDFEEDYPEDAKPKLW
eukprot:3647489-Ditylum_brightwellii.AAC.1